MTLIGRHGREGPLPALRLARLGDRRVLPLRPARATARRPGLASGLLLSVVGVLIWLVWPARPDSRWKLQGAFGSGGKTVAEARAERADSSHEEGGT